jgi:uncharacterized protein
MKRFLRPVLVTVTALAVLFLVACGFVAGMARGRPEWRHIDKNPTHYGLVDSSVVFFQSRDHMQVAAWWIPAQGVEHGRATVVLVHGIGGNRSDMLPQAKFLVAAGYDVLSIDLRAHGDSAGEYPSPGYLEVAEVEAAIAEAHRRSPRPVVLLGHSVGAVAVLHTASRGAAVAGTIADSAFISSFDMFDRLRARLRAEGASVWARMGVWFVGRRSLAGVFDVMLRVGGGPDIDAREGELPPVLPKIAGPVLFVTGTRDDIAPTANAHAMARLVGHAEVVELAASHHTYRDAGPDYERAVLGFLDRVVPPAVAR